MIKITKRDNGRSHRVQIFNEMPSRTQQQFQDEVNVNSIMRKYRQTGQITHLNNKQGRYADLTSAPDYFESVNSIRMAQEAFDQLPSEIRNRFHNNPAEMLEFIHDPKNHDEGVKLGIFNPKLPPLTDPLPQTNDDLNDDQTPKKPKSSKQS